MACKISGSTLKRYICCVRMLCLLVVLLFQDSHVPSSCQASSTIYVYSTVFVRSNLMTTAVGILRQLVNDLTSKT